MNSMLQRLKITKHEGRRCNLAKPEESKSGQQEFRVSRAGMFGTRKASDGHDGNSRNYSSRLILEGNLQRIRVTGRQALTSTVYPLKSRHAVPVWRGNGLIPVVTAVSRSNLYVCRTCR